MTTRILAVAIDATSPELVDRWCADGTLPNLAALRARGHWGPVRGLEGFYVGSTWPSAITAASPGRHGLHYQVQLVPGSYRLERVAAQRYLAVPPFWRTLGDAGRRVAVLDVPLCPIDPEIAGVQSVEWGSHDAFFGFDARPAGFRADLLRRFGPHPMGPNCDAARRGKADYRAFVSRAVAGVERKRDLTRWVLQSGDWDLVFQVFTEAHCTGHQCWHLHDPAHPAHDPAVRAAIGDPVAAVYRAIDAAIGDLLAAAPGARIMVFSCHGMGSFFGGQFLLGDLLTRLGVTAAPPSPGRSELEPTVVQRIWRRLPMAVRRGLEPLRRAIRDLPGSPTLGAHPATSRCFAVGNGQAVGGIRLNLLGREPAGLLRPGEEARGFVENLREELLAIEHADSGRPAIQHVWAPGERYQGPALGDLPDLLVEWNESIAVGSASVADGAGARYRLRSARIGELAGVNQYGRTGEHRRDGFFIATGTDPARPGRPAEHPMSVLDLAPTLTAWLGLDLPHPDGRPHPELG